MSIPSTRSRAKTQTAACTLYTDGGARGNPGPAAAAAVIVGPAGTIEAELSEYLGVTTNNVAEYRGLILGLRRAAEMGCRALTIKMDSELVVRQLNGVYRVKEQKMLPLHADARRLMLRFDSCIVSHVPRTQNKHADKLVNAVLDARAAEEEPVE